MHLSFKKSKYLKNTKLLTRVNVSTQTAQSRAQHAKQKISLSPTKLLTALLKTGTVQFKIFVFKLCHQENFIFYYYM